MTTLTRDQTVALTTAPGQHLRPDAAAAWDAAVHAYGSTVLLTDSLRPYDTQERIFRDRYRPGNHTGRAGYTSDVRHWQGQPWTRRAGTAAAAVPGTSNHGAGLAVDVCTSRRPTDPPHPDTVVFTSFTDADRARFLDVARAYGWADDEGRSVNEWWHLTYYPARDTHPKPPPTPAPPTPTPQHDDETETILMAYPFMFRADTQDGWTIALSPTRTVAVPVLKGDEGKALRDLFGEPQIVGPEMARRLRETLR